MQLSSRFVSWCRLELDMTNTSSYHFSFTNRWILVVLAWLSSIRHLPNLCWHLVASTDSNWFDGNFCQLLMRIELQLFGQEYQAQVQIHRYSRTKAQLLLNQLFFLTNQPSIFLKPIIGFMIMTIVFTIIKE